MHDAAYMLIIVGFATSLFIFSQMPLQNPHFDKIQFTRSLLKYVIWICAVLFLFELPNLIYYLGNR